MTSPDGASPDGSLAVGMFRARQLETEDQAAARATDGAWKGSWDGAQDNLKAEFISAQLVNGEIVRLDNRIDEVIIGTERAFLYTYSESDVWDKHPAAYKVVVDAMSGATNGRRGVAQAGGEGGYGGGWDRKEFTGSALENLPQSVAIIVGAGAESGSSSDAGGSEFGDVVLADGATPTNYGIGGRTYKMRGGRGGAQGSRGVAGSDSPSSSGGSGGPGSSPGAGGHGFSISPGVINVGSAGGGGGSYVTGLVYSGGPGGHGGWPSAPGGGGGGGFNTGAGGNGAPGAVFVTVYVSDEFGNPPSTPVGLTVSGVTPNSARVSWDASTDDVMVKSYIFYLDGTRAGVVTSTYYDLDGLQPATTYEVRVQAMDLGDNASELSAPFSFVTTA